MFEFDSTAVTAVIIAIAAPFGVWMTTRLNNKTSRLTADAASDVERQRLMDTENSRRFAAQRVDNEELRTRLHENESQLRASRIKEYAMETEIRGLTRQVEQLTRQVEQLQRQTP